MTLKLSVKATVDSYRVHVPQYFQQHKVIGSFPVADRADGGNFNGAGVWGKEQFWIESYLP